ncbi:uncharacterized protein L969DRAFT_270746 [Mixia osmundae IAM 14324]|uniref:Uncharacterized protein n=1 Tax=Mixia osmundae (strain CBS 9802 / IAM 14324 / JCM 22182 / KY 12970) TaxID=764103 RepID=G7DV31_MIXOS|nr:uncharacterized protein L969DRAFT_270746 [Mixia osmundae IAM 14324]KEI36342.1 hypothetical protein L969DRAFT_270746 [Mixia osmundae IAM 14324]GAA94441.1 hypothetical protein E5Q_01093 [Mixia osmundae IAM 14324]
MALDALQTSIPSLRLPGIAAASAPSVNGNVWTLVSIVSLDLIALFVAFALRYAAGRHRRALFVKRETAEGVYVVPHTQSLGAIWLTLVNALLLMQLVAARQTFVYQRARSLLQFASCLMPFAVFGYLWTRLTSIVYACHLSSTEVAFPRTWQRRIFHFGPRLLNRLCWLTPPLLAVPILALSLAFPITFAKSQSLAQAILAADTPQPLLAQQSEHLVSTADTMFSILWSIWATVFVLLGILLLIYSAHLFRAIRASSAHVVADSNSRIPSEMPPLPVMSKTDRPAVSRDPSAFSKRFSGLSTRKYTLQESLRESSLERYAEDDPMLKGRSIIILETCASICFICSWIAISLLRASAQVLRTPHVGSLRSWYALLGSVWLTVVVAVIETAFLLRRSIVAYTNGKTDTKPITEHEDKQLFDQIFAHVQRVASPILASSATLPSSFMTFSPASSEEVSPTADKPKTPWA